MVRDRAQKWEVGVLCVGTARMLEVLETVADGGKVGMAVDHLQSPSVLAQSPLYERECAERP